MELLARVSAGDALVLLGTGLGLGAIVPMLAYVAAEAWKVVRRGH
jgi:hypothetical protein